ncbi:mannitol-1-phosphate 5-dehydrogenase [Propionispora vibrioides]|uniref:Mannitol-1-phosphate 5-dehydrogenase n=2 Tax=Propionispora vibrioides TaxID=112903 RepID=A0A1H8W465_9FIRM|nr:mannitol-1-phosphate 5-dehydrogenase [Propionispora vibrioides]
MMKAVHFGAGNIGRGFIGSLLHHSGYAVTFVDVNKTLVQALREKKSYEVVFIDEQDGREVISGVSALDAGEEQAVIEAIVKADLITTAVFVTMLDHIAGAIVKGLRERIKKNQKPLHIMACENAINASSVLKAAVYRQLTPAEQQAVEGVIGFPNVAIDRQAINRQQGEITTAYVERFYEMTVNESQLIDGIKPLQNVSYVRDLEPYIERKLFLVNAAHAITAYMGYLYQCATIQQALEQPEILTVVNRALAETACLLQVKHGFSPVELQTYIQTLLRRFANPLLSDQIARVARSPLRKLGMNERLVGPARQLLARNLPAEYVSMGIAAALLYDAEQDEEAEQLQIYLRDNGLEQTLLHYSGLDKEEPLLNLIKAKLDELRKLTGRTGRI